MTAVPAVTTAHPEGDTMNDDLDGMWRGTTRAHYRTQCLSCGVECPADDLAAAAHRRWAIKHARAKRDHHVSMEMTRCQTYKLPS